MEFEPSSFRDPSGSIFYHKGSVYRKLSTSAIESGHRLLNSSFFAEMVKSGEIIPTEMLEPEAVGLEDRGLGEFILRHEGVSVVSYPFEWSFEMLRDAALLTLSIQIKAMAHGYSLKDATGFNILFRGGTPVFIDIPSLELRHPGRPWQAYGQFCRALLYPLLIHAHLGVPFQSLLKGYGGEIPLSTVKRLFGATSWLKGGVLANIVIPAKLEKGLREVIGETTGCFEGVHLSEEALNGNLSRLFRLVRGLRANPQDSGWLDYSQVNSYSHDDEEAKTGFVERFAQSLNPNDRVVDLGTNTGRYARLVAHVGQVSVVALDADQDSIDALYRESPKTNLLPLVIDLVNPTPNSGWLQSERRGIFERIKSNAFLALALIHHLRIAANIPLHLIVDWLATLGDKGIIEWVNGKDPMARQLMERNNSIYSDYSEETFLAELSRYFDIEATLEFHDKTRRLYWIRKRK